MRLKRFEKPRVCSLASSRASGEKCFRHAAMAVGGAYVLWEGTETADCPELSILATWAMPASKGVQTAGTCLGVDSIEGAGDPDGERLPSWTPGTTPRTSRFPSFSSSSCVRMTS